MRLHPSIRNLLPVFVCSLLFCPSALGGKASYKALVSANNRFAIKLFKQICTESRNQNVITSPMALSESFALLLNGTDATAQHEILTTFDWDSIPLTDINDASEKLRAERDPQRIKAVLKKAPPYMSYEPREPFLHKGAIWFPKHLITPAFRKVNAAAYGYDLYQRKPTAPDINAWASKASQGKIPVIASSVGSNEFVVASVTYFNDRWFFPFDPKETHPADFTLVSGEKVQAQLMPKTKEFHYFEEAGFQAIELPFDDAMLFVFLPRESSSLAELIDDLTPDKWEQWMKSFKDRNGHLELPRFELGQTTDAQEVLESMGVHSIFQCNSALTPMIGPVGGHLTRVSQVTSMKVDETGAEVKSYTVTAGVPGGVMAGGPPPPPPFRMIVNRPFFFAIVEDRTQQLLFVGAVLNPKEQPHSEISGGIRLTQQ
jgi:serine protease inhibitor